ncbi:hypothetical protein AKJ48_02070 [candidate division MSBL1 archaeon SCGC-AAA261O19]|uniref:Ferredoxin--nitrite reductase n=1 Tax=candidate division MSBL1 archaeon SCGC-AAA261O19 TaxID=1698277 RepID=A0A133VDW8_9EURY|nr:hypothetical protein AKJ48_02070 [candidate division MSBL1 archaeon SCGC-AAA261O19]
MNEEEYCPRDGATFEKALKVNPRERLKAREVCPLDVIDNLNEIVAKGYEEVPEEDFVLLKWWGVIHEKPKIGKFSIRIGIPGGRLTPTQLREAGELAKEFGDGNIKVTTRQGLHIFGVNLKQSQEVMDAIKDSGLELAGGCGDAPRNITTCPLAGLNPDELFDPWNTLNLLVKTFVGNREYASLPHKYKISLDTSPDHCNIPEINDVALLGVEKDGEFGFTPLIGGGGALPARHGRHMPVFLDRGEEAVKFVVAYMNAWQENPKYRMSFAKARSKFLVDDCDMDNVRKEVESRIGYELEDYLEKPTLRVESHHLGVGEQKQEGLKYIGFPILSGMLNYEQAIKIADLAEEVGAELRATTQQNLIFVNLPEEELDGTITKMEDIGFTLKQSKIRKYAIGCTGHPYCVSSLGLGTSAREELEEIINHLEETIGDLDLTINSAGCPNGCSRPWLADIGIQGTSKLLPDGERTQAFNVLLGGGRREGEAVLARLILKMALPEDVKLSIERVVRTYLNEKQEGETFKDFTWRHEVNELKKMMVG